MTPASGTKFEFREFLLDPAKRLLFRRSGEVVPLMPKVYDTLLYFLNNPNRLIEKDELMQAVWTDTVVEENNLNQAVSFLRRTFGEKRGENRFIATIPGRGYEFVAEVVVVTASEDKPLLRIEGGSLTRRWRNFVRRPWGITVLLVFAVAAASLFIAWQNSVGETRKLHSIAVLPFKPLVSANGDEALELGMADTLIAALSRHPETVVMPLSSVRKYSRIDQDGVEAGRQLGADAVLDGNIQRWGDTIRVNVRLMRVADGSAIWTGTFDESFSDIFTVQEAISERVVGSLVRELSGEKVAPLTKRDTSNALAYEFYLRGRYHLFKITRADNQKAIENFSKALDADPEYARAYAGLAEAFRIQSIAAFASSTRSCPKAREYALKALQLDDTLTEAHITLGWIEFLYDWNWSSAESKLVETVRRSPNDSEAHRVYGHLLSNIGRHDEAVSEGRRAAELAPLTLITSTLEGYFLLYAGRSDEAASRLISTIDLDPTFWASTAALGRVRTAQARYDEAITILQRARELAGDGSIEPSVQLAYALAKAGRRTEALEIVEELHKLSATEYVPSYFFAMIYNGLGDREITLHWLEDAFREREVQLVFLYVDTRWDWLRSDLRFARLVHDMNFPQTSSL